VTSLAGASRASLQAASVAAVDADQASAHQVLKELRAARRRRRIADFDPFEALYRAYLTGIILTVAVLLLSGVTGDTKVAADQVARVRADGGPIIGLAVAVAFAVGLRSGGRGGPLVVEAADVRHVLLAPVDRGEALRGPAVREIRFAVLVGAVAGGIAGLLALRRLPGAPVAWVACGALVGAVTVAGAFGSAMIVSGRRLGRWMGAVAAIAVLAWAGVDAVLHTTTSPFSLLGQLALWPLEVHPVDLVGVAVALAAAAAGLALVGGTSLEASERRASLVGQIRFAATLQDLRTVIVLRRQLAQELPRQRPWLRLRRSIPRDWLAATAGSPPTGSNGAGWRPVRQRRLPVWRRSWHGILRWPALRYGRLAVLGAVAGLAAVGVWRGTTPLVVVAGLALYVAGLDAVEPVAQEIDHPDRRDEYDVPFGRLYLRQLAAPAVLMVLVGVAGLLAAAAATEGATLTWQVGGLVLVPSVLAGLGGAAISVIKGPPPPLSPQAALIPEAAGARAMGRIIWPPTVAVLGVLPVLAGRDAFRHHHDVLASTSAVVQLVIFLDLAVGMWVRWQSEAHAWIDQQMELSKTMKPGSAAQAP
jgi:hypothetical protein